MFPGQCPSYLARCLRERERGRGRGREGECVCVCPPARSQAGEDPGACVPAVCTSERVCPQESTRNKDSIEGSGRALVTRGSGNSPWGCPLLTSLQPGPCCPWSFPGTRPCDCGVCPPPRAGACSHRVGQSIKGPTRLGWGVRCRATPGRSALMGLATKWAAASVRVLRLSCCLGKADPEGGALLHPQGCPSPASREEDGPENPPQRWEVGRNPWPPLFCGSSGWSWFWRLYLLGWGG